MSDDQLRGFLDGLGLADYFDAFAAERIELADLLLLSEADLAELGLPLGPRRRIMRAVGDHAAAAGPESGERRNLTVLFCDMVDSTSVASRIDPEDLRTRYRAFRTACVAAIEAEGGFVAHRMGDGLMAHFGFPRATEDAAICAVRAGLEIVARVARLNAPGGPAAVRVGVASGLTVIEASRDGRVARDEMATGATLALAARLQALAEPGTIVVSDATRRLLRDAFELRPLGRKTLKGFADSEAVWMATGTPSSGRPAATREPQGTLHGRATIRADLLAWWQDCLRGRGRAVMIEGEPGIGKSRLLAELSRSALPEGDLVSLQCSRHRHGAALHPVTEWLEASVGRDAGDATETRLAGLPGVSPASLPHLAAIMGTRARETEPKADPAERQSAIADAVLEVLSTPAGKARMLLVEDLHWADDATLDVLDRLAECARNRALLFVVTTRPNAARLPQGGEFRRITLAPLSRTETDALVASQAGAAALPDAVRRTISERSGGVPFFAVELTRAMIEAPDANAADVPITLQDALMARLDRLDAGKPVALAAALIGHQFSGDLLTACFDLTEAQVLAGLDELVRANLVQRRPGAGRDHAFHHALAHDVAYESILRSRRVAMHRRVAETVEARFPELAEARPEMVAHHYTEAGEVAPAVAYWERAAESAGSHAAPKTAVTYFNTALSLLARLPAGAARDEQETHLRVRLNMPLTVTTGFSSDETEDNLSRMAELFESSEPSEAAIQLLWSRCMSALVRSDLLSARVTAQRLADAISSTSLPNASRVPQRILGYVAMLEGELDAAEAHFAHVLEGYAPDAFDSILPGHPFDVRASTLAQHAILMALRGRVEAVDADQAHALARVRELGNPPTSFQVLVHLCLARFELGDHDNVPPLLSELRAVVDQSEMAPLYVELWEAWLRARNGALDEGLADMARAQNDPRQYRLWMPGAHLLRADLLAGAGRHDESLALIDECAADIGRLRHNYLLAEAKRRRASCLAALGAPGRDVETLLREAVEIAGRQGASRFESAARQDLELYRLRR